MARILSLYYSIAIYLMITLAFSFNIANASNNDIVDSKKLAEIKNKTNVIVAHSDKEEKNLDLDKLQTRVHDSIASALQETNEFVLKQHLKNKFDNQNHENLLLSGPLKGAEVTTNTNHSLKSVLGAWGMPFKADQYAAPVIEKKPSSVEVQSSRQSAGLFPSFSMPTLAPFRLPTMAPFKLPTLAPFKFPSIQNPAQPATMYPTLAPFVLTTPKPPPPPKNAFLSNNGGTTALTNDNVVVVNVLSSNGWR